MGISTASAYRLVKRGAVPSFRHHVNGDKLDNRSANLEAHSLRAHARLHSGWSREDAERRPEGAATSA